MEILNNLSKCNIFKNVPQNEIQALFSLVKYHVKTFQKDEVIAFRGSECSNLLILLEGEVKAEMQDFSGKVVKIEEFKTVVPLASGFLFSVKNQFPVDIIAQSQTKMLFLPKSSVMELCQKNPIILNAFLSEISNRVSFLSRRIWFISFKTIKQKLAHFLLEQKDNVKSIILPMSIKELADFFGVARPSLSRILIELAEERIIENNKGVITILDRNRLIEIADSEN